MFSKTVNKIISDANISRWSISGRLTFFFSLASLAILLSASLYLYWELVSNLLSHGNRFLHDKATTLEYFIKENPKHLPALSQELAISKVASKEQYIYYVRVVDSKNKTQVETPFVNNIIPKKYFPIPAANELSAVQRVIFSRNNDKTYIVLMQRIKIDNNSYNDFIVQIALDVTRDHQIISQYRVNLTWMLLIGLFLSVVLSKFVTSQGIKPIKELTTAMQSINVSNLNQRIRAKRWPEELVQPADAFNKMLERIESAFQRLNDFSSNMAHELRTPINNLMGETEIALSSNRTVEEYQEVLSSNLEEYHKLSSVIDRLLFLARADNLRVDLQMKSFDVSQELESIIESYEHVAAEQKIKITYDGNAILTADPILFKRAVANIISNALKYTQEMGSIHISVDGENNKDFFVITISDTGVGISDKCIGFLFDRFYRVDSARNQTSVPGTGLGLSIVKSIMELHGGEINITSEVGIGTTVKLFFPKN